MNSIIPATQQGREELKAEILKLMKQNVDSVNDIRARIKIGVNQLIEVTAGQQYSDRCEMACENLDYIMQGGTEYSKAVLAAEFRCSEGAILKAVRDLANENKIRIETGNYCTFMFLV